MRSSSSHVSSAGWSQYTSVLKLCQCRSRPCRTNATPAAAHDEREQSSRNQRCPEAPPQQQLMLTSPDVPQYVAQHEALQRWLGGSFDDWEVLEMRGGVINACWQVNRLKRGGGGGDAGAGRSLIVKQALPYVRAERMRVEAEAMAWMGRVCPSAVPQLLLYDPIHHVLAMPLVAPPHRPLVEAVRDGEVFPDLAPQLAALLSSMFSASSADVMGAEAHAAAVAGYANSDIVAANEQVVLIGPFEPSDPSNSWLPELDNAVAALWWAGAPLG
ncbi:hypothetical protein MNEG_0369 [Monoraphidium neglectum]|uniref:Aminoglycoside phosphotransferase domain-containing protein n=1 Tax=Monoraphidium neglectum TaxID=145388 RepID=A0A0D2N5N2_9CHLO|nr:hypothetical protein MNEG_0369 [Monoraphidium neglectum]KIZ07577.1 hypothetical protein MNEG_0369 [Monoraphidium neglectum]|eukprot:XP_013906596.1 hypothetical protein MNEG_0369 [Monoraphidium neglectum]